jgi:arabinogalactan endo-1,4-beta-galactosidase
MPRSLSYLLSSALSALLLAAAAHAAQPEFIVGADVSALTVHEKLGVKYRTADGKKDDALALLRASGVNSFRLRLFVAPDGVETVTNDLPYTLALAQRVKASGASLLLDIHYSDTWADPQKQFKPGAWSTLPFEALQRKVRDYTRAVLHAFDRAGCRPDYVQIGNEITNGMLWPEGRVEYAEAGDTAAWDRLATLLKAGIDGLKDAFPEGARPGVVLHIESTGNSGRTLWWIRNAVQRGVPFDMLGFSFYPEWHGKPADLAATLALAAKETGRPVMVAEVAYPWKSDEHWAGGKNLDYPLSPAGQEAFLRECLRAVKAVPEGRGAGIYYWYPEAVQVWGLHTWVGGSCGLFDDKGRLLPGACYALPKP